MKEKRIDSRRKLNVPGNKEETLDYATHHWVETAQKALSSNGKFTVALSGGSTPKEIFRRLATEHKKSLEWEKVFIFWSDERSVSPTDPDSNYYMAMEQAGLKTLPLKHVFRMQAEDEIKKGAEKYEALIRAHVPQLSFDLIMLGMGEDGHTASLFPQTRALQEESALVVANHVPQKKTWRMTFTYPLLNAAKQCTFYVLGSGKQEPLSKVLAPQADAGELPSFKVGTPQHPAQWICDESAASALLI
jgi:6-phosphogluconolactonase